MPGALLSIMCGLLPLIFTTYNEGDNIDLPILQIRKWRQGECVACSRHRSDDDGAQN